eukprot:CAMPEP_0196805660 /NCGR_PEP_ID=MMETSP1362-20130617/5450_1 /TAXON_ID=163516 /ORGANISM="Leptocylindrus danicus, Strain CCMP1856" /LENGTH=501 /DNA_ID=CAMNT_0042178715 /DNA_START=80 /DNA_END=1582 /DNA_ORIENTATION=+
MSNSRSGIISTTDVPMSNGATANPIKQDICEQENIAFLDTMNEWVECERELLIEFSDDDNGKIFSDDSEDNCDEDGLSAVLSSFKENGVNEDTSVSASASVRSSIVASQMVDKNQTANDISIEPSVSNSYTAVQPEISTTSNNRSKTKGQLSGNFVNKLAAALSSPDTAGILHWLPDGTSFEVVDPDSLEEKVLPKYFKRSCKYSSFVRKLNMWGFKRVTRGHNHSSYHHKCFLRDRPELLPTMKLTKAQTNNANGTSKNKKLKPLLLPNRPACTNNATADKSNTAPPFHVPCHRVLTSNVFTISPGSSTSPQVSVTSSEYSEIDLEPIMVDLSPSSCVSSQDFNPRMCTSMNSCSSSAYGSYRSSITSCPTFSAAMPSDNNNYVPSARSLQGMSHNNSTTPHSSQARQAYYKDSSFNQSNDKPNKTPVNLNNKLSFGMAMQNGAVFNDLTVPKPTGARYSSYGYTPSGQHHVPSLIGRQVSQGQLHQQHPARGMNHPPVW